MFHNLSKKNPVSGGNISLALSLSLWTLCPSASLGATKVYLLVYGVLFSSQVFRSRRAAISGLIVLELCNPR